MELTPTLRTIANGDGNASFLTTLNAKTPILLIQNVHKRTRNQTVPSPTPQAVPVYSQERSNVIKALEPQDKPRGNTMRKGRTVCFLPNPSMPRANHTLLLRQKGDKMST